MAWAALEQDDGMPRLRQLACDHATGCAGADDREVDRVIVTEGARAHGVKPG